MTNADAKDAPPPKWPAVVFVVGVAVAVALTVSLLSLDAPATRRNNPRTTNAYVGGDVTAISARLAGYLVGLPVADNQPVRAGQLVGVIEDDDYRAAVAKAAADLAAARAQVAGLAAQQVQLVEQVGQVRSSAAGSASAIERTGPELARQEVIARTAAGTARALDEARADQRSMEAKVAAAQAEVVARQRSGATLAAQQRAAEAAVAGREAALRLAELNLGWTRVVAPADGVLGARRVRVGDLMAPGTRLVSVTPLDGVWVDANFTERQIVGVRIGDRAWLRVDAYPRVRLEGRVVGMSPVTGGRLSAVAPDNTTGNFTKVAARVTVRIAIVWGDDAGHLRGLVRPGMSVTATVASDGRS